MKNILITGGTGFIGSHLVPKLNNLGYKIFISSRSKKTSLPHSKLFDFQNLTKEQQIEVIEESNIVINLAGAGIADKRWTSEYKKNLINSRISTTTALTNAIIEASKPPELFISASAVGFYGNRDEEILDEQSDCGDGFLADLCVKWEEASSAASSKTRLVNPRIGVVFGNESGALPKLLLPFKMFVGGSIGNGKQYVPWIHIADIIDSLVYIIENEKINGAVNLTAPNPITMKELAKVIGRVLSRPSIFDVPEFAIKLLLGESAAMVLEGQRAVPKVLLEANYKFQFDNAETAISSLLEK